MNNYGYKIAAQKAKQKEQRKLEKIQKELKYPKKKKKKPEPVLDLYPSINNKKFRDIDWDNNEMVNCSNNLLKRYEKNNHKLQIINLDTGFGKTALAIHYAAQHLNKYPKANIIIVAPRAVKDGLGWHETLYSYNKTHKIKIQPYMIETPDRFASILDNPKTFKKVIKELDPNSLIILDEIHNYKTPTSKRSKKLQKLPHIRKLGLTATAISNDMVLDGCSYLIMDGKYRNKTDFFTKSDLANRIGFWGELLIYDENGELNSALWPYTEQFKEELAQILFKPSINPDNFIMPQVNTKIIELESNNQLISDLQSLKRAYLDRAFDSAGDFTNAVVYRINSDKDRLDKLLKIVKKKNIFQPLIFYHNTAVMEKICEIFDDSNIDYQVVSGDNPISSIDKSLSNPILIQYQAGAEGIEFAESNTTIFYQNQYSFIKLKQAKGRNVRRGKDHKVTHYYVKALNTPDEEIFNKVDGLFELNSNFVNELIQNYQYAKEK